jgi:hypothetical protein
VFVIRVRRIRDEGAVRTVQAFKGSKVQRFSSDHRRKAVLVFVLVPVGNFHVSGILETSK